MSILVLNIHITAKDTHTKRRHSAAHKMHDRIGVFRDFLFAMTSCILLICCFLPTNIFTLSFKYKTDHL